jgi:SNF2 family DNA or RNA helicase
MAAPVQLRPYQRAAADFLFRRDRAMLLAPVGAGKTAATLTAMAESEGRWLVIAPLRVATSVWPAEAARWAPGLRVRVAVGTPNQRVAALYDEEADVVVSNYDNLQWLADHDLSGFTGIVFDELTRLKNPSGKRFKALEKVIKDIDVRWGLTGSFTSNGLEDVFGQVKIIDQKLLGRSKGAFQQQYFFSFLRSNYVEYEPRPGALEQVMDRIRPATYVLEPGVYTDTLPPLHTVEVPLTMDLTDYETMRKNFVLELGNDEKAIAENAAVVTQKLQQMASGFVYALETHWQSTHKLDALADLLDENQRAPTIVWYQYVAERDELMRRHKGARDVRDPGAIEDWNAGKVEVLLAHPASAGHGLNLQHGGCRMVWLTLPWSLELYEQAVGRLHRSGQRHDVWNYVLLTDKTVDHKIWAALRDKKSLASIALEALKC